MFKIKHIIFLVIIVLGISLSIPAASFASSHSHGATIEKNNGQLTINIKEEGDYYKIYKEGEVVYEGSDNTFKDTMNYKLQKYNIGVYKDNDLIKVLKFKITNKEKARDSLYTNNKEDYINKLVQNTSLETVVGDNFVSLQWPELPDEDGIYEIFRNDVKIGETKDLQYIDNDVKPGTEYQYTLKIENELSDSVKMEVREKAKLNNYKLNEDSDFLYPGIVSTLIVTSDNSVESMTTDVIMSSIHNQESTIGTSASPPPFYDLTYRTFIPFTSVNNPVAWNRYLKGDDRNTFQSYSNDYRTEARVYLQYDYPPAVTLWPSVNPTYSCPDSDCNSQSYEGTASTSGIKLHKYRETTNDFLFDVTHKVGVPVRDWFPNIDYYYLVETTAWTFSAAGDHDMAPSHELWIVSPNREIKVHGYMITNKAMFLSLFGVKTSWSYDL